MTDRFVITLKWGPKYGPEYANRLYRAVNRHLEEPFRFVCFTDTAEGLDDGVEVQPVPEIQLPPHKANTTWKKLGLFREDLGGDERFSGPALFLDLDVLITGPLDRFFAYKPDAIPIIHNWIEPHKLLFRKRPEIGNSSVFRFPINECGFAVETYRREAPACCDAWHPPQSYLTECIRPKMVYWPETWVRSFKRHCTRMFPLNYLLTPRRPPADCSVLAFHGRPNPDQAEAGYKGKKLHHRVRPTPWIREYWEGA